MKQEKKLTRAEEAGLKAYPVDMGIFHEPDIHYKADLNLAPRLKFIEGYEQAEKDLGITCGPDQELKDHIIEMMKQLPPLPEGWYYDFDYEVVEENHEVSYNLIAKPKQRIIIEEKADKQ